MTVCKQLDVLFRKKKAMNDNDDDDDPFCLFAGADRELQLWPFHATLQGQSWQVLG